MRGGIYVYDQRYGEQGISAHTAHIFIRGKKTMLGEKHDLIHEFPEYKDTIHQLKTSNTHFSKLFDEYHEVDHEIHRIEEEIETTSDEYLEERKKLRLSLKDQLFEIIKNA